ncbi:MAG: hypothetical protein JWO84_545 [Parcubacteria group bacterium]|nr:hypothetical protein [Parcubacteria group bacterium]
MPEMPDRTIGFLSIAAGLIFSTYIVLVIVTIFFATVQTSLAAEVRTTEGSIATLETTYYASLARENASTPASAGLVAPSVVEYAIAKPAQGISFAGK